MHPPGFCTACEESTGNVPAVTPTACQALTDRICIAFQQANADCCCADWVAKWQPELVVDIKTVGALLYGGEGQAQFSNFQNLATADVFSHIGSGLVQLNTWHSDEPLLEMVRFESLPCTATAAH